LYGITQFLTVIIHIGLVEMLRSSPRGVACGGMRLGGAGRGLCRLLRSAGLQHLSGLRWLADGNRVRTWKTFFKRVIKLFVDLAFFGG
jgi:hypothetical protein